MYLLFQMHSRLENNHKYLEKAWRSAEARLTNTQLEKIREGAHERSTDDENDGVCGVCQSDMHEKGSSEDESVCLPCSHCFHWKCIREWLHNNSHCPICRMELSNL